jgi:hypothetical protein
MQRERPMQEFATIEGHLSGAQNFKHFRLKDQYSGRYIICSILCIFH